MQMFPISKRKRKTTWTFGKRADLVARLFLLAAILCAIPTLSPGSGRAAQSHVQGLQPILDYISTGWDTLTRSMSDCRSVIDPKMNATSILYLPNGMAEPEAIRKLASACKVAVDHLPVPIHQLGEIDTGEIRQPGLLYLPNKYVVPGGRFNEMYGWDSYFIIRGLLRDGRVDLARGMVENFFFEVENYGAMLNANRTYYLTRSQPPFLSSMVVEVYDAMQKSGHADPAWLARAYADLGKDYDIWTRPPHLAGDTGLSRYYDFGEGPAPEAAKDESGSYRKVAMYFFLHPTDADDYIVADDPAPSGSQAKGPEYVLQVCDPPKRRMDECDQRKFKLNSDYYKGDRSMRESGFDVSSRFGPFGAATHHYAPVCLNTLLYKTEKDLEQISRWLGQSANAEKWDLRAEERKKRMLHYLWNEKSGIFFDFNLQTGRQSSYPYATTFYPLWAGLATPEQAKALVNQLPLFEKPGGLAMSTFDSGAQWDLPYGWGNIELLVVEGLRRYGFNQDADRVSYEFLSMVAENFRRDGTIREKYNVVTRSSEVHAELGYQTNVVGFGWTNAAFVELLHDLPKEMAERLGQEQDRSLPTSAK